jgi:hypothetical protein
MYKIMLALVLHWFADFVLQTDQMARGKSSSNKWLSIHVAVYSLPLFLLGWKFALFNAATHWVVDYFTSRLSSRMWKEQRVHDFFVVIGFDQLIHTLLLVWSAGALT